ncbi:hypothetical protein HY967_04785 [Candidatus Jorgensenbacteria bacterium]|nr:hypothetical protein [Candidatus Jorgensenbacteria bacterium]
MRVVKRLITITRFVSSTRLWWWGAKCTCGKWQSVDQKRLLKNIDDHIAMHIRKGEGKPTLSIFEK